MRLLNSCRLTAGPQADERKWPWQLAGTAHVVPFLFDASFLPLTASRWIWIKDEINPQCSVCSCIWSANILFLFTQWALPASLQINSELHMLRFTFHPWLLMRGALGQSPPACQHVMADLWAKGNGCILTWLFEKCQPCTVWISAERLLAHGEHAHQRRSPRSGNITCLYAGCSAPNPHLGVNASSLFLLGTITNAR